MTGHWPALLLAVLTAVTVGGRTFGPSWTYIVSPLAMSEVDGRSVTWEHGLPALAVTATLGDVMVPLMQRSFNTENYRALVPTYLAAVLTHALRNEYWAFALVDALGLWIGAWALFHLAARLGASRMQAALAAVLFTLSPLAAKQVGLGTLHLIGTASLCPALLAALVVLGDHPHRGLSPVAGLTGVLFVASLVYAFQWVVIPSLLALTPFVPRPRRWLTVVMAATAAFLALSLGTRQLFAAAGMPVHPHFNDPVVALTWRWENGELTRPSFWLTQTRAAATSMIRNYHPIVAAAAGVGVLWAGWPLRALTLTGVLHGLVSAAIFPVPWVTQNGYAAVYIAAGIGVVTAPSAIATWSARRLGSPQVDGAAARVSAAVLTAVIMTLAVVGTNSDLWGDYRYVRAWMSWG